MRRDDGTLYTVVFPEDVLDDEIRVIEEFLAAPIANVAAQGYTVRREATRLGQVVHLRWYFLKP